MPIMKYLTVEEAGRKFDLSARSIRNYCQQGRIAGAVLSGKTWLIPEDAKKPERINSRNDDLFYENAQYGNEMISFINESPVACIVIDNIKNILLEKGYKEVFENQKHTFKAGEKVFIIRNDTTMLAFNIGKNIDENNVNFHVVATHADSPCFKIKPEADVSTDSYHKLNVAPYGGMIASTWMDRPLAVAGRIVLNKEDRIESTLVNYKDLTVIIPNLCIHFNRNINNESEFNMNTDMVPLLSCNENVSFKEMLAKRLDVEPDQIMNYDLYCYNKQGGVLWGEKNEFVSSCRLDDLQCVYTSMRAFVESDNDTSINVMYIADNEEVGSHSHQGADSDFLRNTLKRVCLDLNADYEIAVANSFLVSADNAHAVHPNKPEMTDKVNKTYMNKGIVIKFNSTKTYTSDGISSAIFQKICSNAHVPYQFFANRSDLKGGSTLGNILLSQVSLLAVDVGLPEIAMHSAFETAGTRDIKYAIDAFKEFYSSNIVLNNNTYNISKNN